MRQPELGKKISELRKAKGLTQEELVEKCNISVRTIQRIETGDVTPRMYTIKTILAALDHDLDAISDGTEFTEPLTNRVKDFLIADIDPDNHRDRPGLVNQLNIAWIAGIVYFALGFLEAAAEYYRFTTDELIFGSAAYVAIKLFTLVSVVFFLGGLIAVGGIFGNYLLKIVSMILIGAIALTIAYDIVSIFYDSFERQAVLSAISVSFGGMGIIFGIALRRLDRSLGRTADFAGLFEIMAGCFFLTVFFAFMGFIVQIPAILLEIILIYKTMEIVKAKEVVNSLA
jgi:transcriptional regulator with XRE-family HTH domain